MKSKRRPIPSLRNTDGRMLPSYQRTRNWLVDYISEKGLDPGDKMPSERDLADALSLSRPTVARAISELIKEGLLERKERLGTYVRGSGPNSSAARTGTVGVIMPWLSQNDVTHAEHGSDAMSGSDATYSMASLILRGAISVFEEAGLRLVIHTNGRVVDEIEILRNLPSEGLDGAIVVPTPYPGNLQLYSELARTGPPVVLIDRYFPNVPLDSVATDNTSAARQAVEHLIGLGHTRIAYFTCFDDVTSIADREEGYRAALEDAGIPFDEDIVCGRSLSRNNQWDYQYALEHCLGLPEPVTAVFCLHENVLSATMQAADRLGIRVPEDLTVAGFFDLGLPVGMSVPFIRVVQDMAEVGRTAAKLLIEKMAGGQPQEPRHLTVPAELKLPQWSPPRA